MHTGKACNKVSRMGFPLMDWPFLTYGAPIGFCEIPAKGEWSKTVEIYFIIKNQKHGYPFPASFTPPIGTDS